MLLGLAGYVLSTQEAGLWQGVAAALFALPFVLFSPMAGWLADRYSKQRILWVFLLVQLIAAVAAYITIQAESFYLVLGIFFLLAMQSAFYSPAKQGILIELVGSKKLGMAVGLMEMATILAILLGMAAGQLVDLTWTGKAVAGPWDGAEQVVTLILLTSILSLVCFYFVPRTPSQSSKPFQWTIITSHLPQIKRLWRDQRLRYSALGSAWFYSLGAFLSPVFFRLGAEAHDGEIGSAAAGSQMMLMLGVGIALGSLIAAFFSRKRIELGVVPLGAMGIAITLFLAGLPAPLSSIHLLILGLMGMSGALFVVPLTAYFQNCATDESRGDAIAGSNLLMNIGAVIAGLLFSLLAGSLNLSATNLFIVAGLASLLVTGFVLYKLPTALIRLSVIILVRLLYELKIQGREHVPAQGGALLICNHISYVDAVLLQTISPRPIRFMAHANFEKMPLLGWGLRSFDCIFVSPSKAKEALKKATDAVKEGTVVCIFPEGGLTEDGELQPLQKGFEVIARRADCPVIPVVLNGLWGSIFSYEGGRYFWKWPSRLPYPVEVIFDQPMEEPTVDNAEATFRMLSAATSDKI